MSRKTNFFIIKVYIKCLLLCFFHLLVLWTVSQYYGSFLILGGHGLNQIQFTIKTVSEACVIIPNITSCLVFDEKHGFIYKKKKEHYFVHYFSVEVGLINYLLEGIYPRMLCARFCWKFAKLFWKRTEVDN